MYSIIKNILQFNNIWISSVLIILAGVLGNFILASVILVILFFTVNRDVKNDFLLIVFLFIYFLSDNLSGTFGFAQNFRFVVLGVALIYLLDFNLTSNNLGNYILPFSIVACLVSILFSPVGVEAILRSASFWLVAIALFKLISVSYSSESERTSQLLILALVLYFGLTFILMVFAFLPDVFLVGRLRGLMGNPNGLGLLAMFSYALIDLLKIRGETSFKNSFFLGFKVLILVLIIFTGSRTALFSIIIYEIILRLSKNKAWLVFALLATGFIYFIVDSINLEDLIKTMGLSDFLRFDSLFNASGRTEVWKVAWEEIKKSPWLGNGMMYDNYYIHEFATKAIEGVKARSWSGVWSSYISLLMDVGIVGLITYGYFFIKVFQYAGYKNLAVAFIFMSLFSGITESWMAASMNSFTPMFFLYWAIQSIPPKTIESQ